MHLHIGSSHQYLSPQNKKSNNKCHSVFYGAAEVTKLELIINKFIEKVRTFEMFELGRMIDCINSRKVA